MRCILTVAVLITLISFVAGCGGDSASVTNAPPALAPNPGVTPGGSAAGGGGGGGAGGYPGGGPADTTMDATASDTDMSSPTGYEHAPPPHAALTYPPGYSQSAAHAPPPDATLDYPPGYLSATTDGIVPGDGNLDYGGGIPGYAGPGGRGQARPTTLDGLAKLAFQQGRERDALLCLYGWGLATDAGAAEILSSYQWAPDLKRPALAVRWAIGVQLTTPPKFTGDPKPIGSKQNLGKGRRGGERGAAGQDSGGYSGGVAGFDGGDPGYASTRGGGARDQTITRYTGEFGEKLLQEFQSRASSGAFGRVLVNDAAPTAGRNPYNPGGDAAYGGTFPGGIPGDSGSGYPGASGGYPGAAAPAGRAAAATLVSPGLTMLGIGTEKELFQKAKLENADVLAILRVEISINRADIVVNETQLVLRDAAKPQDKPLYITRALKNTEVELARQGNKDDGIDKEVEKLFAHIDAKLTLTTLPELPPESVKSRRVDVLVQESYGNLLLPVLAEIRFYHRSKLLSDEDTIIALKQLMGNEEAAKALVDGSEDDRKAAIEKWLPKI